MMTSETEYRSQSPLLNGVNRKCCLERRRKEPNQVSAYGSFKKLNMLKHLTWYQSDYKYIKKLQPSGFETIGHCNPNANLSVEHEKAF
jgi:hypothetical protein